MSSDQNPDLRIALLNPEDVEGDAARALASPTGHMSLFRLMAHAPTTILPIMRLGRAILGKQKLDGRLRELAILVALRLEGGRYEWPQHVDIARSMGLGEAEIAAVERLDFVHPFAPPERAVVDFARQSVEDVRVDDAVFAALRRHLDEREVVELVFAIGYYMMLARLTEAVELVSDPVGGRAVLEASQSRG
jgi:alkylhydroperoxidase family enzyme